MKKRQKKKIREKKQDIKIIQIFFNPLKNNSPKISDIIGILGLIVAILTFIIAYFGIYHNDKPKADIQERIMSVSYLSELGNRQNKYPMFNDDVNNIKKYNNIDNCATQIIITNDYDNEILLEKMIFEAKDIIADNTPVLEIDLIPNGNSNVDIMCVNHGWGDANNVTIELCGEGLDDFIVESKRSIIIPLIKAGERIDLPIWDKDDLLNKDCTREFYITANCVDINKTAIPTLNELPIYISFCEGQFSSAGGFGPSEEIYGVKIDTSNEEYQYEYNISECIKAKERMELPICFYPDKSCKLKFRVTFKVVYNNNNDRMDISTDWADIKFQISSVFSYGLNDVSGYSKEELIEMIHEFPGYVKVTYPAVDRMELEGIEPILEEY